MIAAIVLATVLAAGADQTGTAEPYRVGGDVLAPKIVRRVEPKYSEAARLERVEGIVIVEAVITADGKVESVLVLKPLHPSIDEEVVRALLQWRFKPGTKNGEPVACILNLTSKHSLNESPPRARPPKSLVGMWQVPGERIWVGISRDNRAAQCRFTAANVTAANVMSRSMGIVGNAPEGKTIEWENGWPTDSVRRDGDDLLLTSSVGTVRLRPTDYDMPASCSSK